MTFDGRRSMACFVRRSADVQYWPSLARGTRVSLDGFDGSLALQPDLGHLPHAAVHFKFSPAPIRSSTTVTSFIQT